MSHNFGKHKEKQRRMERVWKSDKGVKEQPGDRLGERRRRERRNGEVSRGNWLTIDGETSQFACNNETRNLHEAAQMTDR